MEVLMIAAGIAVGVALFTAAAWFLGFDSRDGWCDDCGRPELGPGHRPTWF